MEFARKWTPWTMGIVAGLFYAVVFQLMARKILPEDLGIAMSFGFVFFLPVAMGFLTVQMAAAPQRKSWLYRVFAPMGCAALAIVLSVITGIEGWICVIMGGIIMLPLAALGGVVAGLLIDSKSRHAQRVLLYFLVLAPGGSAWVESKYDLPENQREARTYIDIQASPEAVWKQIERVRKIDEPMTGFFYRMGFPKPIEATLSHEGVGGVRQASFEGGLLFVETITGWKRLDTLSFAIKADPKMTPLTTLDEHVTVGGRYFDVLQGSYRIERMEEGWLRLHLSSRFRVSTRFNFYSNEWAEFLMSDIQNSILKVIKQRSEKPISAALPL